MFKKLRDIKNLSIFIITFIGFTAGIIIIGMYIYDVQSNSIKARLSDDLKYILETKIYHINEWRENKLHDAEHEFNNPFINNFLIKYFSNKRDNETKQKILKWMNNLIIHQSDYTDIILLNKDGSIEISTANEKNILDSNSLEVFTEARISKQTILSDLCRIDSTESTHFDLVVPCYRNFDERDEIIGIFLIRINPFIEFYNVVQSWPIDSKSAEVLLVRRNKNEVEFLNELRHQKNTALNLKLPLDSENLPAAKVITGKEYNIEGNDYRGVKVFAAGKKIPNTQWFLVAKVDSIELFKPLEQNAWYVFILIIALIVILILAIGFIWRHQRVDYFRNLFENQEKFRKAIIGAPYPVIIHNEDGEIIAISDVWTEISGYTIEEIPTVKIWAEKAYGENKNKVLDDISKIYSINKKVNVGEYIITTKDGNKRIWDISDSPLGNDLDGKKMIVSSAIDVTEIKKANELILENEIKFHSLFDSMNEGACLHELIYNERGEPTDYRILEANKKYELMTGISSEKAKNQMASELYQTKPAPYLDIYSKVALTGESIFFETYFSPMNKYFEISVSSPKRGNFATVFLDITERKLYTEKLRLNEEKYRELFNNAPISYHELDVNGIITRVNQTELNLLGYNLNEMMGHYIWEFLVEKEHSKVIFLNKILGKEKPPTDFERTYIRKDGALIQMLIEDVLLRDIDGEIIGIRSTLQDITERKRNEIALQESNLHLESVLTELRETQKQVLQQERLRALGQMASGIAHDINNSLTPVLGYADYLLSIDEIVSIAEVPLTKIKTSSLDIKRTIERMKEFYRPRLENLEFNMISLNNIILSTIDLTKHRWKDIPEVDGIVINIKTELDESIPLINGNESEIREAFANIIINSCDALLEGGEILFKSKAEGEFIFLEVRDNGHGMDEETCKRCLEPFYSTKGEKGTGLGLSMVFGIVQRHDGQIEIESEIGKGTAIKIKLPKTIQTQPLFANLDRESKYLLPKLKILCIDDDTEVRELLAIILQKDHNVKLASGGKEGVKIFLDSYDKNERFDIVITDLGMPYLDGKSVAQIIKNRDPEMPVILMTGWGAFLEKDTIKNVDYVVKKPLVIKDLFEAISKVLKVFPKSE